MKGAGARALGVLGEAPGFRMRPSLAAQASSPGRAEVLLRPSAPGQEQEPVAASPGASGVVLTPCLAGQ